MRVYILILNKVISWGDLENRDMDEFLKLEQLYLVREFPNAD